MRTSLLSILAALALGATLPGVAAAADIGSEDFNYAPLTGAATGSKPESKLWFNDGIWWGALFNPASGQHRIHRLNTTTQQWTSTAATIDARRGSRSDVLWDGASNKLYAASHIIAENTTSHATTPANSGRVYRYSYNASTDTYTQDAGFPVTINGVRTETLVLDKDSTGRLWATWTAGNRAWVAHTNGTDTSWGAPYQVPGVPALDLDDISSLIHFGGNRIGVMVSNQIDDKFWFASHNDGAGDAAADWSAATIPGLPVSDDHINLKKDSTGRVFAAVKTSANGSSPLTMLLRRNVNGTWSSATFGTGTNSHTRPIVLIDEPANQARMYATCPQAPAFTSGQSGGDICEKVTSLDTLAFPSGIGTAVIRDEGSAEMNDATSTKQGVNAFTGAVVVANNPTTDVYWHRHQSLGGTPPPPAGVTAQFTGTPTSGTAPLDVAFSDTSTGSPTTWSWDFGDGGTSNLQNPSHQYTASGTYTVTLTAGKTGSTDTMTRTSYITVGSTPPPGGTQTFPAVADANTKSTSPTANYGTATTLRARQGTSATDATYRSHLRFDVQGLTGTVTGVKLRLFSTDGSKDGGAVYGLGSGAGSFWSETGITWNDQPALPASSLASLGVTSTNAAVEIDLGAGAVSGNGPHSFAIQNASTDSAIYSSREGATRPELVVTTDAGGPPPPPGGPTAQFTGTPISGQAPLNVTFSDTSTGSPTSWSWSFGDGGTSTAQNPTHVYSAPGSYDVTLTATSADGSDAETKTGYITVGSAPPPGGGQTILPMADAHAKSTSATTNYGAIDHIRLRQGTSATDATYVSYLKFEVTGLTGPVSGAKLRLFTYDGGPDGGSVFEVDDTWAENTLTWNARPAVGPTSIASAGTVADNTTVEWDLGTTITGNGVYSFAITTTSTNSVYFRSRESAQPPELVLPG